MEVFIQLSSALTVDAAIDNNGVQTRLITPTLQAAATQLVLLYCMYFLCCAVTVKHTLYLYCVN